MLNEREYSAKEVCEAASISNDSLQNWLKRKVIVGHGEIKGDGQGPGRHRRFSFYAVMQISVAAELIKASGGMDLKTAFDAAMTFSHSGAGKLPEGFVDDGIQDDEQEHMLALPFPTDKGATYLFVSGGRSVVDLVKDGNLPMSRIARNLGGAHSFIALNLTALFFDVARRLGIEDPGAALKAAYAG